MKHIFKSFPLLFVAIVLGLFLVPAISTSASDAYKFNKQSRTHNASLSINVSGFEALEGAVMVALFADKDSYQSDAPLQGQAASIEGDQVTVNFQNLKPGQYAFKLFHDVNNNGQLDTNSFGMPTEPYYFSNDASDPFSAPEWNEAQFKVYIGEQTKTVSLN